MDQVITESDAAERIAEVLREVRNGTTFVVTADGRPVAKVSPVEEAEATVAEGEPTAHDLARQAQGIQAFLDYAATLPRRTLNWRREDLYD